MAMPRRDLQDVSGGVPSTLLPVHVPPSFNQGSLVITRVVAKQGREGQWIQPQGENLVYVTLTQ